MSGANAEVNGVLSGGATIIREGFAPTTRTAPDVEAEPPVVVSPGGGEPLEEDDIDEHTVLAVRKRPRAHLQLPDGSTVALTEERVFLGRKVPQAESDGQIINVKDTTRTVSKLHARLDLIEGVWHIEDLGSTNGILLDVDGVEREIAGQVPVKGRFLLGDAEFFLSEDGI